MSRPISISLSEAANRSLAVKALPAESLNDTDSVSAVSNSGAGMAVRLKPKLRKALITSSIVATNGNSAVSLRESAVCKHRKRERVCDKLKQVVHRRRALVESTGRHV